MTEEDHQFTNRIKTEFESQSCTKQKKNMIVLLDWQKLNSAHFFFEFIYSSFYHIPCMFAILQFYRKNKMRSEYFTYLSLHLKMHFFMSRLTSGGAKKKLFKLNLIPSYTPIGIFQFEKFTIWFIHPFMYAAW